MNYVIHWKNRTNGRTGKGTKEFEREQAETLCAELNQAYPDIEHVVAGTDGTLINPPQPVESKPEPQPFTPPPFEDQDNHEEYPHR